MARQYGPAALTHEMGASVTAAQSPSDWRELRNTAARKRRVCVCPPSGDASRNYPIVRRWMAQRWEWGGDPAPW